MQTDNTTKVIYEDDELIVHILHGSSEYVVLTFGDLLLCDVPGRFFADSLAKRLGITCVGVVAKSPNWYPQEHVLRAYPYVHEQLKYFDRILSYGGSMGGYAAVKYSRLFKVSHVLALCPQWSIDPEECGQFRSGYAQHFKPFMTGMGVQAKDLDGNIYLCVDPLYPRDFHHAWMIAVRSHKVRLSNVHYVDHHVTPVFADTETFKLAAEAIFADDEKRLTRIINRRRRMTNVGAHVLLRRSVHRHPLLSFRASRLARAAPAKMASSLSRFYIPLIAGLLESAQFDECGLALAEVNQIAGDQDELDQIATLRRKFESRNQLP